MARGRRDPGQSSFPGRQKRKPKDKRTDEVDTQFENFEKTLEQILSVPKEELDKRRAEYERKRKGKRLR